MGILSWLNYKGGGYNTPQDTVQERILACLATLASGQNPDGTGFSLPITQPATAANILDGYQTFAATAAATTVITVPAGRTWSGTIALSCSAGEVGAGTVAPSAFVVISVSGAGATPVAGNYLALQAQAGANVAAGTVGDGSSAAIAVPFVVVAGAAASALIQATTTQAGTASNVYASCIGVLL